jgi:peroxiredoxin
MRLELEQQAPSFTVESAQGGTISLEQFAGRPLLLMFHRYAGCPMCNLRLHDFARRFPEWHERGLEAVAFFHSPAGYINENAGGKQYPFAIAADPKLRVYRKYGVATSWRRLALSMARPSVYSDLVRAFRHGFRGGKVTPRLATMPADFFIRPDGRIQAIYYGRSIADHMPNEQIDEALAG